MASRLSRFDNRPLGLLSSKQACELLQVKPATLYTYVSRGLIRKVAGRNQKERLYLTEDVESLAAKAEARRGHRAVAVGALRFGDPVLDTEITSAGPDKLLYRGHDVLLLVQDGLRFESVAEILWKVPATEGPWPRVKSSLLSRQSMAPTLWRFAQLLPRLALADAGLHHHAGGPDPHRARHIVQALSASLGAKPGANPARDSIAGTVAQRLGLSDEAISPINTALVLVADHELNISTFAARVAASGGADLYASVGAALYAFSGPRHGGAPARIAALVDEVGSAKQAPAMIRARLDRGEPVPGFGHPLYARGDPRTAPLVTAAIEIAARGNKKLATVLAIEAVMQDLGPHEMTVDGGLVALAYALGLGPEAATALFCVGRAAGWAAHVFEQRQTQTLLRPTARYVGPHDGGF